jgi:uncharacterized membrane protein YgcG
MIPLALALALAAQEPGPPGAPRAEEDAHAHAHADDPDGDERGAPFIELPELARPVVDAAGVLPDDVDLALSRLLHAHRDRSGVAVGVVILPRLGGAALPETARAASERFQQGFARNAPWVLVVIAVEERRLRIEGDERLRVDFTEEDALLLTQEATRLFAVGDLPAGVQHLAAGIVAETPRAPTDARTTLRLALLACVLLLLFIVAAVAWRRRARAASMPPPEGGPHG